MSLGTASEPCSWHASRSKYDCMRLDSWHSTPTACMHIFIQPYQFSISSAYQFSLISCPARGGSDWAAV
jgi:hypothetical protein